MIEQVGRKYVIVGDFNGHSTLWDPTIIRTNQCGRELSSYIADHQNMALITTPGLPTYTDNRTGKTSTLDLAMCSNNLIHVAETFLLGDSGSDHMPVKISLLLTPDTVRRKKRPNWKIKEDKIPIWKNKVLPLRTADNEIGIEIENFTKSLIEPAQEIFGKTSGQQKPKYAKAWWTPECSKIVAQRRRARKTMERRPTIGNIIEYKRLAAKAKRVIKITKRETWRKFCSSLTKDTPPQMIWNMIKNMSGTSTRYDIPLVEHGMPVTDPKAKAEIIADSLDNILGLQQDTIDEASKERISAAKMDQIDTDYNTRFTLKELKESIDSLPPKKATGEDEIHNTFLKNLPDIKHSELLGIINRSWRTHEIPAKWTNSLIIPIAKQGKDLTDPQSYRPISLLSCASKVMEKMINTRLTWFIESTSGYSHTQCGFRKQRSPEDLLVKFEHEIRASLVNKKITMAVFFDLKQAFDTISHDQLILKLAKTGVKGNMLHWLEEFLKQRTYQVLVEDSTSEKKSMRRGIPQGSCLSPTLFNVMVSDIPHIQGISISEFADDIAILITTNTIEEAYTGISLALTRLEEWANTWNLIFNPVKTKCMYFARKKIKWKLEGTDMTELPHFKLLNEDIEWVKSHKYLGLTVDAPNLTWNKHIEEVCRSANQRLNMMRAVAGTSWGVDREILLNFYTIYIRPKLTYGITAIASTSTTTLGILEKLQNTALRISLGARNTTPILSLQAEANIPPLNLHIKELCSKYYFKLKTLPDEHPTTAVLEDETIRDKIWSKLNKKPFIKRSTEILHFWQLPNNILVKTRPYPSAPPWKEPKLSLHEEMPTTVTKDTSNEEKLVITQEMIYNKYNEHVKIYTDGSIMEESAAAALWIPDFDHQESWKMDYGEARSIMAVELTAINMALLWVNIHSVILQTKKIVILTDSRAGIAALKKYAPRHHKCLLDQIKNKSQMLTSEEFDITIQWLPSHVGTPGNEQVDQLAKAAHAKDHTNFHLEISEINRKIRKTTEKAWHQLYEAKRNTLHLGSIKKSISHWPWAVIKRSRKLETTLARLRMGHVGLNDYLARFKMKDDPNCTTCQVPEDAQHYLLECRQYNAQRNTLRRDLAVLNVNNMNLCNILGGGSFPEATQNSILSATCNYILATEKLDI